MAPTDSSMIITTFCVRATGRTACRALRRASCRRAARWPPPREARLASRPELAAPPPPPPPPLPTTSPRPPPEALAAARAERGLAADALPCALSDARCSPCRSARRSLRGGGDCCRLLPPSPSPRASRARPPPSCTASRSAALACNWCHTSVTRIGRAFADWASAMCDPHVCDAEQHGLSVRRAAQAATAAKTTCRCVSGTRQRDAHSTTAAAGTRAPSIQSVPGGSIAAFFNSSDQRSRQPSLISLRSSSLVWVCPSSCSATASSTPRWRRTPADVRRPKSTTTTVSASIVTSAAAGRVSSMHSAVAHVTAHASCGRPHNATCGCGHSSMMRTPSEVAQSTATRPIFTSMAGCGLS